MWKKQKLEELAEDRDCSKRTIQRRLDKVSPTTPKLVPCPTVVIPDTTFWDRDYGVVVFRSPTLKKNIWWNEVSSELMAHYHYGRKILESRGWSFLAAVVDGRRGLITVFEDIPVQMCHFHQQKIVTRYLTRKPETLAGQELKGVALRLTKGNEKEFNQLLNNWHKKWGQYINEKTLVAGTKHWYYTHRNVRSTYMSLKKHLPYLYTYQKYPELNIPNTTNSLDGFFGQMKPKITIHRGLRKDRRYKVISELLGGVNKE